MSFYCKFIEIFPDRSLRHDLWYHKHNLDLILIIIIIKNEENIFWIVRLLVRWHADCGQSRCYMQTCPCPCPCQLMQNDLPTQCDKWNKLINNNVQSSLNRGKNKQNLKAKTQNKNIPAGKQIKKENKRKFEFKMWKNQFREVKTLQEEKLFFQRTIRSLMQELWNQERQFACIFANSRYPHCSTPVVLQREIRIENVKCESSVKSGRSRRMHLHKDESICTWAIAICLAQAPSYRRWRWNWWPTQFLGEQIAAPNRSHTCENVQMVSESKFSTKL